MKLKSIISALLLSVAGFAYASDCEMFIQVLPAQGVSPEISDLICSRLERALTAAGTSASPDYGQFYVVARCNDLYKETIGSAPMQTAVHTELTLGIADVAGGTVFATRSFDLRGVGTTEQRAFINALKTINASNKALESFINDAKDKTVEYFNKNYKTFLAKAQKAADLQDYDQALYFSTLIPECSKGYAEASAATARYYQGYIDEEGAQLLNAARAAFSTCPNAEGAAKAYAFLSRINVRSSAYGPAQKYAEEIARQTKVEYDFEVHQKYEDEMSYKRAIIDAAREVGVAYGKGQKSTTTNILWK